MSIGFQVTFDAADPAALARFWAVALDYVEQPPPAGWASWDVWAEGMGIPAEHRNDMAAVVDPDGQRPRLLFQKVPEGKTAKNRVHLDVNVSGPHHDRALVDAHAQRLAEAGGRVVAEREQRGEFWVVMTDPEGNEFCVQ
jgi:hypothetical protein